MFTRTSSGDSGFADSLAVAVAAYILGVSAPPDTAESRTDGAGATAVPGACALGSCAGGTCPASSGSVSGIDSSASASVAVCPVGVVTTDAGSTDATGGLDLRPGSVSDSVSVSVSVSVVPTGSAGSTMTSTGSSVGSSVSSISVSSISVSTRPGSIASSVPASSLSPALSTSLSTSLSPACPADAPPVGVCAESVSRSESRPDPDTGPAAGEFFESFEAESLPLSDRDGDPVPVSAYAGWAAPAMAKPTPRDTARAPKPPMCSAWADVVLRAWRAWPETSPDSRSPLACQVDWWLRVTRWRAGAAHIEVLSNALSMPPCQSRSRAAPLRPRSRGAIDRTLMYQALFGLPDCRGDSDTEVAL